MDQCALDAYPVSFPSLTRYQKALIVGALYRQSLINVGFSPDSHVYDLNEQFLLWHERDVNAYFLLGVKKFYEELPDLERRIFLCECLEKGRHYPFWWMEFANNSKYLNAFQSMLAKTSLMF